MRGYYAECVKIKGSLLAADPASYTDTKYSIEDVSNNITTADTPTLYRIKSGKRVKYAKEMIKAVMRKLKVFINPRYIAKDYFMPYEGDITLMQRGLVKRVVNNTSRKYRIEEINGEEIVQNEAAETRDVIKNFRNEACGQDTR